MWEPVSQREGLSERIIGQVEKLIGDESLKPGERLPPEREMAQLLGVSRPSLREAVRILQARGRLQVKHGQGVFVEAPRSERELRDALDSTEVTLSELFAMREVLEVPAAAWAAERVDDEQLHRLRATLDRINAIVTTGPVDFGRLRQLDTEFHMAVAAAAGNRFLRQTSHVLHDMLHSGMETTLTVPGRPELSRRDHERLYRALAAHDPAAARRAVRRHIRAAHSAAVRRIEQAKQEPGAEHPGVTDSPYAAEGGES